MRAPAPRRDGPGHGLFRRSRPAQARAWQDAGFAWLHVVDLNGAFAGRPVNGAAVARHPRRRAPSRCSSAAASATWPASRPGSRPASAGSSWAAPRRRTRPWCARPAARSPAASSSASMPATAWSPPRAGPRPSRSHARELALRFEDAGVAAIIYTDIGRDGMLCGLNLEQTVALASARHHAGDRLRRCRSAGRPVGAAQRCQRAPRIEGVIVGRALYDGRVDPAAGAGIARPVTRLHPDDLLNYPASHHFASAHRA